MNHLGDITKISGYSVPPVDVVIGGSPCQDLSVAGKQKGLSGERSGLFMEQVRIIKEMRCATNGKYPRYMVWENVCGALSSNKGADFGTVLWETAKIADGKAPAIPMPKRGWPTAGCLTGMGRGWSIAWRVLDAQFWGVPQRRRRIALVADFGGASAPEILFEREGVSGNPSEGGAQGQGTAANFERSPGRHDFLLADEGAGGDVTPVYCIQSNCIDRADTAGCNGAGWREGVSYTLNTVDRPAVAHGIPLLNDQGGSMIDEEDNADVVPTLRAEMHGNIPAVAIDCRNAAVNVELSATLQAKSNGGQSLNCINPVAVPIAFAQNQRDEVRELGGCSGALSSQPGMKQQTYIAQPVVYDARGNGDGHIAPTMTGDHESRISDYTSVVCETHAGFCYKAGAKHDISFKNDRAPTLRGSQSDASVVYEIGNGQTNQGMDEVCGTLNCMHDQRAVIYSRNQRYIVRRLTPLECERLQGFSDGWTDIGAWTDTKGKLHKESSDSARYKALGNSIAILPWTYVLRKLTEQCGKGSTMASCFDGLGGFPLIWERLNGEGTCLWASEIEEFPIAVTKQHFGAKEADNVKASATIPGRA